MITKDLGVAYGGNAVGIPVLAVIAAAGMIYLAGWMFGNNEKSNHQDPTRYC